MGPKGSQPRKNVTKKQDELYCSEEDGEQGKVDETGFNHQVLCTTVGCEIWTDIWLPKKINPEVLKRPYTCGFCSSERIESLIAENTRLHQTIRQHNPEKLQQTFAEIVQKQKDEVKNEEENRATTLNEIRMEERRQKAKECNLIIVNPPNKENETVSETATGIISKLGINDIPIKVEEIITRQKVNNRRMLLVQMTDSKSKWLVISKAKDFRNSKEYENTYINPDLTPEQRRLNTQLRKELKEKRESDPNGNYKIYRNKIIKQE